MERIDSAVIVAFSWVMAVIERDKSFLARLRRAFPILVRLPYSAPLCGAPSSGAPYCDEYCDAPNASAPCGELLSVLSGPFFGFVTGHVLAPLWHAKEKQRALWHVISSMSKYYT